MSKEGHIGTRKGGIVWWTEGQARQSTLFDLKEEFSLDSLHPASCKLGLAKAVIRLGGCSVYLAIG